MPPDDDTHSEIAHKLAEARDAGQQIPPLTEQYTLTVEDAYRIQSRLLELIASDKIVFGYKIGATNKESQEAIGAQEPSLGYLFEDDFVSDNTIRTDQLVDPRIEPEIGFLLGEDLPGNATSVDVLGATRAVVPALEIADSRIQDWQVRAEDLIADNSLAGQVIVGETIKTPSEWNASLEAVRVTINGRVAATGMGTQVLEHPARAVAWLANKLEKRNETLQSGEFVLSGGLTPPIDVAVDDAISVEFTTMGHLLASVE